MQWQRKGSHSFQQSWHCAVKGKTPKHIKETLISYSACDQAENTVRNTKSKIPRFINAIMLSLKG